MNRFKYRLSVPALLLAIALLSACGDAPSSSSPAAAADAVETAPPTAVAAAAPAQETATLAPATAAPVAEAPAAAAPAPTAPVDWLQTASLEGDYFTLGNPDAPVRILDYSDFL